MKNRFNISKLILGLSLIFSLTACSQNIELLENEIQIYVGQQFNPEDFLVDSLKNNDSIEILNGVDLNTPGNYEVVYTLSKSQGILKVTILDDPITLTAKSIVLEAGTKFDPNDYISEESRKNNIEIISNIDLSKPGDYIVVYSYSSIEKVLDVTVKNLEILLLESSITIDFGSAFDPKDYILTDFPNSSNLEIKHNVDANKVGNYLVSYLVRDETINLNVEVKDVSPILTTSTATIKHGSTFNPLTYLIDSDRTNSNIIIDDKVDTNVSGTYLVTYKLGEITKTLSVNVSNPIQQTQPTQPTQTVTPTQPSTYNLSVISLTSPVSPNENATIIVQGKAGKQYSITVYYKSGPSSAAGLEPKVADENGRVSWTWKIGPRTTAGDWKITITGDGKTLNTSITVR